jgi:hypothetical protein
MLHLLAKIPRCRWRYQPGLRMDPKAVLSLRYSEDFLDKFDGRQYLK